MGFDGRQIIDVQLQGSFIQGAKHYTRGALKTPPNSTVFIGVSCHNWAERAIGQERQSPLVSLVGKGDQSNMAALISPMIRVGNQLNIEVNSQSGPGGQERSQGAILSRAGLNTLADLGGTETGRDFPEKQKPAL